jgi:hypothetical protein
MYSASRIKFQIRDLRTHLIIVRNLQPPAFLSPDHQEKSGKPTLAQSCVRLPRRFTVQQRSCTSSAVDHVASSGRRELFRRLSGNPNKCQDIRQPGGAGQKFHLTLSAFHIVTTTEWRFDHRLSEKYVDGARFVADRPTRRDRVFECQVFMRDTA